MNTRSIASSLALLALLTGCSTAQAPETTTDTNTDSSATVDMNASSPETAEGTPFSSEDLFFSVMIPNDWAGITNTEENTTWSFGKAMTLYIKNLEGVDIFAVTMFTDAQWAAVEAEEGPKPILITQENGYVWAYSQTQDPTGVEAELAELPQVIASFKATK